jgi:hypothetical protein
VRSHTLRVTLQGGEAAARRSRNAPNSRADSRCRLPPGGGFATGAERTTRCFFDDRCVACGVQFGPCVASATFSGMTAPSTGVDSTEPKEAAERHRPLPEPEPPRCEWWSDEPEMENYQHLMQMLALIATLRWLWRGRTDYFVGGNLTIYFSERQRKSEDFRGPDFFVALGVDGTRERRSWVVWQEDGKYPNVIIEFVSASTEKIDRGEKQIYEDVFRTPSTTDPETAGSKDSDWSPGITGDCPDAAGGSL